VWVAVVWELPAFNLLGGILAIVHCGIVGQLAIVD